MSTEAMREGFEQDHAKKYGSLPRRSKARPNEYRYGDTQDEYTVWQRAWQAATANQEALIRAVIEECAKVCDAEQKDSAECPETAQHCADAIRQNATAILEKMK